MKKLFILLSVASASSLLQAETFNYSGGRCRWHKAFGQRDQVPEGQRSDIFNTLEGGLEQVTNVDTTTISFVAVNYDNDPTQVSFFNQSTTPLESQVAIDCGNGVTLQKRMTTRNIVNASGLLKIVETEVPNCFSALRDTTRETFEYNQPGTQRVQYIYTRETSVNWNRDNTEVYGYGCQYARR